MTSRPVLSLLSVLIAVVLGTSACEPQSEDAQLVQDQKNDQKLYSACSVLETQKTGCVWTVDYWVEQSSLGYESKNKEISKDLKIEPIWVGSVGSTYGSRISEPWQALQLLKSPDGFDCRLGQESSQSSILVIDCEVVVRTDSTEEQDASTPQDASQNSAISADREQIDIETSIRVFEATQREVFTAKLNGKYFASACYIEQSIKELDKVLGETDPTTWFKLSKEKQKQITELYKTVWAFNLGLLSSVDSMRAPNLCQGNDSLLH